MYMTCTMHIYLIFVATHLYVRVMCNIIIFIQLAVFIYIMYYTNMHTSSHHMQYIMYNMHTM